MGFRWSYCAAVAGSFCLACGGGGGGGYYAADAGAGGSGAGGTTGAVLPPICAARAPADDGFTQVERSVPIAGVVADTFTEYVTGDVAIGEDVLVVGLPSWLSDLETDQASVLVFRFDGENFRFERELLPAAPAEATGQYGDAVEISHSGRTIIAANRRSAFIFRWNGSEWTGGEELAPRNAEDHLASVSITDERAAVGYYSNGDLPGSVYVYRWDGSSWALEQRIVETRFDSSSGTSAAIDGEHLVIADRQQSVHSYTFDGSQWIGLQDLGASGNAAVHGTHLIARSNNVVIDFEFDGTEWVRCDSIGCNEQCDVSVFGGRMALGGSPAYSSPRPGRIFSWDGSAWQKNLETEFAPRNVDIGRYFAVLSEEGFAENPIHVVQLAAWP